MEQPTNNKVNTQQQIQQQVQSPVKARGIKLFWLVAAIVLTAIIAGGAVYLWQNQTAEKVAQDLRKQINTLQNQIFKNNNQQEADNCLKEGVAVVNAPGINYVAPICCDKSLKQIPALYSWGNDESCSPEKLGIPYDIVCANCGNGVCGLGENKCNCPADCVSSTWNSVNPISSVSSTSSSEIAGWKTYRNDGYGYEIKYPDDWFLSEFCEGSPASSAQFCVFQKAGFSSEKQEHQLITGGVPNDDDINIHVFKKGELQGASLREAILGYATTGGDNFPILADGITSRGLSFILYKDSTYPQSFQHAFFESPDSFYVVEYIDNGDNSAMKLNVFSRMISTFKFTK